MADTCVLPLDDDRLVVELFRARGREIAALLIEPIPANAGLLRQRPEFLRLLRDLTTEHGALLVLDEVISGFRIGMGGAAALYGIILTVLASMYPAWVAVKTDPIKAIREG